MGFSLFSANAPWNSTRFYEEAVKETLARFILTLWNSYNFFTTYASLDSFDPKSDCVEKVHWSGLDKWIHSRFHRLIKQVETHMESFEIHKAARIIEQFLLNDLSNWYLRRSRKRLWVEEKTKDKLAAYTTMYEMFLSLIKLLAPFTPFISEEMYQNLRSGDMKESIHLCNYPKTNMEFIDDDLESGMQQIRDLVEVGRALRSKIGIKVRYPLSEAILICSKETEDSIKGLVELLREEINVKEIKYQQNTDGYMDKELKPNFAVIGPRFKEKAGIVSKVLETLDKHKLYQEILEKGSYNVDIDGEEISLNIDDFEVVEKEKEGIARTETGGIIILMNTILTDELKAEGFCREVVRRIQSMRKELDLDVEQEIEIIIHLNEDNKKMLDSWIGYVKEETRSKDIQFSSKQEGSLVKTWTIDDDEISIAISPSS
ncbi:hypothetical protein B6U98_01605 [Thermoplasmatales archaeon ex4572_165]|nr:MAG: hypothetical protein B6U98_01605 [Thermoplasmatales archaeon ex4572_165]